MFAFFAAYAVAVTFPVVTLFRGPRPFLFGLPLPMVWITFWVVAGCAVLWLLDRTYRAAVGTEDAAQSPDGADVGRDG
jgi:hypothetical protein